VVLDGHGKAVEDNGYAAANTEQDHAHGDPAAGV
jgi:hypothetical protein